MKGAARGARGNDTRRGSGADGEVAKGGSTIGFEIEQRREMSDVTKQWRRGKNKNQGTGTKSLEKAKVEFLSRKVR